MRRFALAVAAPLCLWSGSQAAAAESPGRGLERTGIWVAARVAASAMEAWASTITSASVTRSAAAATSSR